MSVLTKQYVISKVKTLLPLGETDLYDDKLDMLVSAAISKMKIEGVDIEAKDKQGEYLFQEGDYLGDDYVVCVSYQIMKDMDFDADMNYMTEQYITRINTIRCSISHRQS